MENNHNNIDQFYNDRLSGYRESLSEAGWSRMKRRLFWLNFRKYAIGFAAFAFLGVMVYSGFFFTGRQGESLSETIVPVQEKTSTPETRKTALLTETNSPSDGIKADEQISENSPVFSPVTAPPEVASQPDALHLNAKPAAPAGAGTGVELTERLHAHTLTYFETKSIDPLPSLNNDRQAEEPRIDSISYAFHDIRKSSWISVSLYAAPAYSASTLSADPSLDDYLNYRNGHESGTVSWSAGADVQFNFRNWYIQTGLNYATFSDKRNYNYTFKALDTAQSYFTTDTTWGWVYDPPDIGRPIVLSVDTSFVPVYNEINEGINTWKYLEIPLLVGYTFHFNLFSIDVGTGFSYGLLLGANGNVPSLTEENRFTDLSGQKSQMNRHNLNYILQIGAAYRLSPQWSLIVQPYYKQNLRSVFENNVPVDQRFKAFSIKFGLKVDL